MKLFEAPINTLVCYRDKFPYNEVRETFYIRRDRKIPETINPEIYCATDRLVTLIQASLDDLDRPHPFMVTEKLCPSFTMKNINVLDISESYFAKFINTKIC